MLPDRWCSNPRAFGAWNYPGRVTLTVCPGEGWSWQESSVLLSYLSKGRTGLVLELERWLGEVDPMFRCCTVLAGTYDHGREQWNLIVGGDHLPEWSPGQVPVHVEVPAEVMKELKTWARGIVGS